MSGPQVRQGVDLKIYNRHLMNVKNATSKTDNKAPKLPISVYIKDASFYSDISRLRNVDLQNRELLKKINILYRTKGQVDCQLEKYIRRKTMYANEQKHLEKQRKRNVEFLDKLDLKYLKSTYNQENMLKDWKRNLNTMKFSAKYPEFYERQQTDSWTLYPENFKRNYTTHPVCYFDLKIGDLPKLFRIEIEIYSDVVLATATNFISFCQGFNGLTYKGSVFYRIIPDLLCIGGDIVNNSGTGGISVYGPYFPDENFILQHNGPGVVAMYTSEPDKNNSQFLITFKKLSSLNNKYVVIGKVKKGFKNLKLVESCGTKSGKPRDIVKIEDCGVYEKTLDKPLSAGSEVL